MELYRHTQTGSVIVGVTLVGVAIALPPVVATGTRPAAIMLFAVVALLAVAFSTLTIIVDDTHLRWHFTFGLIRGQIALGDISQCRTVRNPWYYGWGIHLFPGGVLYNVSGFKAVEISRRNGRRVRIGTDEPEVLCRVIDSRPRGLPRDRAPEESASTKVPSPPGGQGEGA
jgi:hypothetical protein